MLDRGEQVGTVARNVGYTSTNGYIDAFRRHLGTTPKAFAQARRDVEA